MEYFVKPDSIVRQIWGKSDTILFIFAGASAEFAVNKAVDWLYFTGKLPSDPLGRLFSTVAYARQIVFSEYNDALAAIDKISSIHHGVEQKRGMQIPDWAYRDVLFMLIDYSIRSYEVLERKLTQAEKTETFAVFYKVGARMGIPGLPPTYASWEKMRAEHIKENIAYSDFTIDLYAQYRKHLGSLRFLILKEAQALVTPAYVNETLDLGSPRLFIPVIMVYKFMRLLKLDQYLKDTILPTDYRQQIAELDVFDSTNHMH